MVKAIVVIALLSLTVSFNSYANDSDRIVKLEKEIQEIKLRLSKLESSTSNPSTAQQPIASGDGWKSVTNWRKLANNMSASDVQKILGEPQRLEGGDIATWYYRNGGSVIFIEGKVQRWIEPRQ